MTARVTLTGLLASFALLAAFVFSTGARAETYRIVCNNGYWFVTNMGGFGYADRKIPCDEPKPGWIFDWGGPHHIKWVYDGDRVVTPYTNPGSNVVRTEVRPVQEQGNTRPPVNQPVASVFYTVPDSSNHRAVRGTDGRCYREWRVGGRWLRSKPFPIDLNDAAEACRKAAWNAYYRSQGRPLVDPHGTFPSGSPPTPPVLQGWAVDGKTLTLTFNENLDPGSLPSRWAFYVTVNGARRHVALGGVAISGQTVKLTLISAVTHLDTVRVRYTRPSARRLRGATGLAVATRLRLGLEGSRPFRFEGGAELRPSVEVGVRQDGGDAETGFGVDVGGGIAWSDPERGLSVDLRVRGLVSHDSKGFREAGLSGSLSWEPRAENGRGPSLTLTQTMGAQASGGADALLQRGTLAGLAANDGGAQDGGLLSRRRLEVRFGYGFATFGDAFTSTPELGFGLSEASRDYRLGWRLSRGAGAGSLDLSLEATRRESANGNGAGSGTGAKPEHTVGVRIEARF